MSSFTCLLFRVILFWESWELELTGWSSAESSFLVCSSTAKPPRIAAFLAAFVLLPVKPVCIGTLGVLTTNEDSDLSFLLTGSEFVGVTSGASTFLLFRGKILALISCRLWSGLHMINEKPLVWTHDNTKHQHRQTSLYLFWHTHNITIEKTVFGTMWAYLKSYTNLKQRRNKNNINYGIEKALIF